MQEQLRQQAERLNGSLDSSSSSSSSAAAAAEAAPAAQASAAVLAPPQPKAPPQQGSGEEQQEQEPKQEQPCKQQARRARRSGRAAAKAPAGEEQREEGKGRKRAPKQSRRLLIQPKDEDLMRWVRGGVWAGMRGTADALPCGASFACVVLRARHSTTTHSRCLPRPRTRPPHPPSRTSTPLPPSLFSWYADATRAAEQAYKLSGRGRGKAAAPSLGAALRGPVQVRRRRAACPPVSATLLPAALLDCASQPPTLCVHPLPSPSQAWLGERLEYMGFEGRQFPSLAPLGLPCPNALHAAGSPGGWSVEPPAGGCGSMLAHLFAEWAQEAGGALPILANQWPEAPTRCARRVPGEGWVHRPHRRLAAAQRRMPLLAAQGGHRWRRPGRRLPAPACCPPRLPQRVGAAQRGRAAAGVPRRAHALRRRRRARAGRGAAVRGVRPRGGGPAGGGGAAQRARHAARRGRHLHGGGVCGRGARAAGGWAAVWVGGRPCGWVGGGGACGEGPAGWWQGLLRRRQRAPAPPSQASDLRGGAPLTCSLAPAHRPRALPLPPRPPPPRQVAAAHHLADNYSSVLGACYFDEGSGDEVCLNQMGGGLQAAALAAAALEHGDDAGLRLPPELAPVQAVIVPVWWGRDRAGLEAEAQRLRGVLEAAGVRAAVDARRTRPGVRFGAADRVGAPLRIEVRRRGRVVEKEAGLEDAGLCQASATVSRAMPASVFFTSRHPRHPLPLSPTPASRSLRRSARATWRPAPARWCHAARATTPPPRAWRA